MLKTVGNPSTRYGDQTIFDGNLVIGTSGKGIDFSATSQSAGMTSELFNDYEEGTWTPVIIGQGTTGVGTYTTQLGRYTKVGRVVHFTAFVVWTAHTGGGGMVLAGLPFSSNATAGQFYQFAAAADSISYTPGTTLQLLLFNNSTGLTFYQQNGGAALSQITVDAAADVIVSGTYFV